MPVSGERVEFWQADSNGFYFEGRERTPELDHGFDYFGAVVSDADGQYSLRTIMPGLYGRRAAHIHIKVPRRGWFRSMLTELYVDTPENQSRFSSDRVFKRRSRDRRGELIKELTPLEGEEGSMTCRFDLHLRS